MSEKLVHRHQPLREMQDFLNHCKEHEINVESIESNDTTLQEWFFKLAPVEKLITENRLLQSLSTILLNKEYAPNLKIKAMECLRAIISFIKIRQGNIFRELYTVSCTLIFNPTIISLDRGHSEEMKEAVIITLTCLVNNIEKESFSEVYNSEMVKVLSVGIVLAISILKLEKSVKIRCLALQFILTVAQHNARDLNVLDLAGLVIINFIPGMMMPFTDIICKEVTVHHSILQLTIRAWSHVLFLALRDLPQKKEPVTDLELVESWMSKKVEGSNPKESFDVFLVPTRTPKWTQAALEVLKPLIKQVAEKHNVLHENARSEMINAFYILLSECSDSLDKVGGHMLDALVGMSMDEHPRVAEKANQALIILFKNSVYMMELAEHQLPDIQVILGWERDVEKIARLLPVIDGYFCIISKATKQSPCLITNPLLLPKLLAVLKKLCCVKWNSQLTHQSIGQATDLPKTYVELVTLLAMLDRKSLVNFENICKYICDGSLENTTCLLIDDYNKKSIESLIFLNLVVSKCSKAHENLSKKLIDFYLNVGNNLDLYSETTPKKLQVKVLMTMLALQGISQLVVLVGENHEPYLLQTLYFVVGNMGSTFTSIRAAAHISACKIAKFLKFESLSQLIEKNIDYLSYHICVKLRRSYEVPTLDAIRVTAELCPSQTLKEIEHILLQLLSKSGANEYSAHVTFFLRLFKAFVDCAKIASNPDNEKKTLHSGCNRVDPISASQTNGENTVVNIIKKNDNNYDCDDCESEVNLEPDPLTSHKSNVGVMLANYIKKRENERLEAEAEEEAENVEAPTQEEEVPNKTEKPKEPLPAHVTISIQIVRRCMNYLPSRSTMQKALCLEIMDTGLNVISQWEDELLPLVHEVWSPLILRFHGGSSPLIILRSFQLLCTLAQLAKDFIRFRTVREALPILREFLIKSAMNTHVPNTFSISFKLQKELLSKLGHLVFNLNLRERETSMVVEAAEAYLAENQHKILANKAIRLIADLMEHDPYFIAYILKLRKRK